MPRPVPPWLRLVVKKGVKTFFTWSARHPFAVIVINDLQALLIRRDVYGYDAVGDGLKPVDQRIHHEVGDNLRKRPGIAVEGQVLRAMKGNRMFRPLEFRGQAFNDVFKIFLQIE